MLARILIALVGAAIVTAGLLLTMDSVTSILRNQDLPRYFRISDILPKPEPGRPTRPAELGRQPAVPSTELGTPDSRIEIEVPAAQPLAPGAGIINEPRIDREAAPPAEL